MKKGGIGLKGRVLKTPLKGTFRNGGKGVVRGKISGCIMKCSQT